MAEQQQSSVENKKWYKNTKGVVSLVSLIVVSLLIPILKFLDVNLSDFIDLKPELPKKVIEIVLDTSAPMNELFENADITKFEAAIMAVKARLDTLVTKQDNLALRIFGGPCSEIDISEIVVPFGKNRKEKVKNSLKDFNKDRSLEGETTLLSAVTEAIGDFKRDKFQKAEKILIVITGNGDDCYPNRDPEEFIRSKIADFDSVKVDFHDIRIVGLGLNVNGKAQIKKITNAVGGRHFFPESHEEFSRAMSSKAEANALYNAKKAYEQAQMYYVNSEYDKALPLFKAAASGNISKAMTQLGNIYYDGLGKTNSDTVTAKEWYLQGAKIGDTKAMINIGIMYYYGEGVEKNPAEAISYYNKAANTGDPEAMTLLGIEHEKGEVIAKNLKLAEDWYRKAESLGFKLATEKLRSLRNQL